MIKSKWIVNGEWNVQVVQMPKAANTMHAIAKYCRWVVMIWLWKVCEPLKRVYLQLRQVLSKWHEEKNRSGYLYKFQVIIYFKKKCPREVKGSFISVHKVDSKFITWNWIVVVQDSYLIFTKWCLHVIILSERAEFDLTKNQRQMTIGCDVFTPGKVIKCH